MSAKHQTLSIILQLIAYSSYALNTQQANNNWATYYEGDAPIIILSQHGGYEEPGAIPNREQGCYNTSNSECIWEHDCEINTIYSQSSQCSVKTLRDSYTKEIATCLRDTIDIFDNDRGNIPHLVINQLHRKKLDPNREIGEATLNDANAIDIYEEIHDNFMDQAKTAVDNQCGFGLVFDIHGQAANIFNQLGYRLRDLDLEKDDAGLNGQSSSTSIENLVDNNVPNDDLATIVRGPNSLGTIMNETYGYTMVPSEEQPYLDTAYYYQGSIGIINHGSDTAGTVDAIQIEINSDIRFDSTKRADFCTDFSRAIETFVNYYYDLSQCTGVATVSPTSSPTPSPTP